MIYILIFLLLFLCVIDFFRNKKILSPSFIFNFIWLITLVLYQLKLSHIQQDLTNRTVLIFSICVVCYNLTLLVLNYIDFKEIKFSFNVGKINKKINFARCAALIILIIEIVFSKGFPLLWKITGSTNTYFDYGIPSLHGAFCGLVICLGAYSMYKKSRDRYFYLLIGIMLISRQILISLIIEWLVIYLYNKDIKNVFKKLIVIIIACFLGFNIIGNIRSGNNVMNDVFQAKTEYKNLPNSVKWVYSYMTFSVSNFNNLVSMTDGNVNKGSSILNELLPTVILNKFHIQNKYSPDYLISRNYTVSTYLPSIYLDFGLVGIGIFNILIACLGAVLYKNLQHNMNEKNLLLYAVFIHNIILLFFINMFFYLPIIIQFIYILIIFGEKKNIINEEANAEIAILMATYNGEKYLDEQIQSIINQSYNNFVLFIRDDNSKDNTKKIIKKYVKLYPEKIVEVKDKRKAGGACKNFMILLEHVFKLNKYDLFMFADQDDVWLNNKIETTINKYQNEENKDVPLLIHTDLYVVDGNLNLINNSFVEYSNLNGNANQFNNYLIQNNVTGCTTLINKKLVELVDFSIKDNILMHDWYFALLASAFGKVKFIDKPTIKYRQHGNNVLGAKKIKGIKGIYNKLISNNTIKKDLNKVIEQGEVFKSQYYNLLDEKNKSVIDDFTKLKTSNKLTKIKIIIKNKFYKQGISRIIGEFIYI